MTIWQDLRYSVRILLASRMTSAVMLLILGAGIGANTAIFSFVNSLWFKPASVDSPNRLVKVFAKGPSGHYGAGFSYPEYQSLRDHSSSFSSLAAETQIAQTHVIFPDDTRELRGAFVSANYFSSLGLQPLAGRFFRTEEDSVPDRDPVAVISADLWKNHFHADRAVIGTELQINQVQFRIIGVAPAGFYGVHTGNPQELWMPLMMLHAARYFGTCPHQFDCSVIDDLVGRLADGRALHDAGDELSRIVVWSASDWARRDDKRRVAVFPLAGLDPDERDVYSTQMRVLMGVAAVLLLISCANLAGLFLARTVARSREMAIRLSLGAGALRIVRQLMTESMLLALCACGVGFAFSIWARSWLAGFYNVDSEGFIHSFDLRADWRVLLFSGVLAIATSVAFGLLPAYRATRQDLITQLKEGAGSAVSERSGLLRRGLVSAQVALSLALLVCAGLMVRSARAVQGGTNFDPRNMAVLRVRTELLHYTPQQNEEFFRRVVERLRSLPAVEAVTFVRGGEGLIWNWDNGRDTNVALPGREAQAVQAKHHDIGLQFFSTMRIPLHDGRDFTEHDDAHAPRVAIVNAALAQRFWPDSSAAGKSLIVNGQRVQVVGVVANIQPANSLEPPVPYLFLPFWQSDPGKEGDLRLALRTKAQPQVVLSDIRRAVQQIDPNIPLGEDMSMMKQIETEYMPVMLSRSVISYSGMLALCLSAIGLFSVLTYFVRTRTREIGIRMALGAQSANVLRLIVGQGVGMGLVGIGVGVLLAAGTSRLLAAWLYGVNTMDVGTYVASAALLFIVALAASYAPALRASHVDPMLALRQD